MKTDGLKDIGRVLQTVDRASGVLRTWRVVAHRYVAEVGRVCEMVTLEAEQPLDLD